MTQEIIKTELIFFFDTRTWTLGSPIQYVVLYISAEPHTYYVVTSLSSGAGDALQSGRTIPKALE